MRSRLRRARGQSMARRPDEAGRFALSPRAMRIGGWLAAALLVVGIALIVGLLGGDGDGTSVVATPSASTGADSEVVPISFGTAIDSVTGEVSVDAVMSRFAAGDPFAYSARPNTPPPTTIYVEVRRTSGESPEVVQPPSPQTLAEGAEVIAFVVPSADLIAAFGTGEFEMVISASPSSAPIARGTFELVDDSGS
jgi:hypothetical protein